jgi:hypothetical protein
MAWALDAMGGEVQAAADAARAAMYAEELGASNAVATVLGRMTRMPPTEADIAMLHQELARIRHARLELARSRAFRTASEPELERMRAHYTRLDGLLSGALAEARRHPDQPPRPAWVGLALHVVVAATLLVSAGTLVVANAGPGAVLGIACLALAYVLYFQRHGFAWLPAACFTLAVLDINRAFGWGQAGTALELLALATVYLGVSQAEPRSRRVLAPCVAIHLILCALLTGDASRVQATVMVGAVGIAIFCAVQASRPAWLALAGLLSCAAIYWIAKAIMQPGLNGSGAALASVLVPLPIVLGGIALGLRRMLGGRWARPVAACAIVVALAVIANALLAGRFAFAATVIGCYGLLVYLVAVIERSTQLAGAGLLATAAAPLGLLLGLGPFSVWPALSASALALAITLGQLGGRGARRWRVLHVATGLAIGTVAAVACLLSPAFWQAWSSRPLAAIVPLAAVSAMLLFEARRRPTRFLWYPALLVSSLSSLWIARFFGATNPLWYVLLTGVTISALGVRGLRDEVLPNHPSAVCKACAAIGGAVPIGIAAYESLDRDPALYLLVLAAETGSCLLGGFWFRNRALVVTGSIGAAFLVLRTLALISELVSPSASAAVIGLLLLGAGVTMATSRARVAQAAAGISRYWRRCT